MQPTAVRRSSRFNKMHALQLSEDDHQCLYEKCLPVTEKGQWPPNNSPNLNTMELSLLGSDVCSYFETSSEAGNNFRIEKSHQRRYRDNFLQVQLTELFRVSETVWQEYVKGGGRHSEDFSLLKKVFTLTVFALFWTVENFFYNC